MLCVYYFRKSTHAAKTRLNSKSLLSTRFFYRRSSWKRWRYN